MSHKSGLHYFDASVTEEAVRNHNLMRELIENETSKIPPGTGSGYHTYTYGWLVDQIVRHTDEKKRGIGQFLREEITQPNGNLTIKSPIRISEMRKTLVFTRYEIQKSNQYRISICKLTNLFRQLTMEGAKGFVTSQILKVY
ncbi:unnamed protein product [Strongylus vulgaris]|uniref:Beta-lactamase-related domain-containing protein n=1 Tax=Strongylus vulgaris TaxID=40348 RepID=A0A3P7LXK7_STRVU|nr:unnamed protein product [Strongylus vulgaris]